MNRAGLSRAAIFNQVDDSLRRLQTTYIDLLQIHRFDPDTPVEETMKALHDLVENGKVRYIGASSMRAWQFAEMNHVAEKHGWTQFVSMQNEYSLLYREEVRGGSWAYYLHSLNYFQEREMIPYCKAHGIGIIPWGPLQAGDLANPYGQGSTRRDINARKYTEADKAIIGRVEELSKKKGWPMSQVALSWIYDKVSSPIVGVNSVGCPLRRSEPSHILINSRSLNALNRRLFMINSFLKRTRSTSRNRKNCFLPPSPGPGLRLTLVLAINQRSSGTMRDRAEEWNAITRRCRIPSRVVADDLSVIPVERHVNVR